MKEKASKHYLWDVFLLLIIIVLLILLYRENSKQQEQVIKPEVSIVENIITTEVNASLKGLYLNPLEAYNNTYCSMNYQDVKELMPGHKVKSWYINSFSGLKLSPKEIHYSDNNYILIILIEREIADNTFFLRSAVLRNSTNNEIIEKFDC